jgi:hypothetical protein
MMGIETMKSVSPKTVDRSTLVQRSSIRLDPAAPREERLREFIKQIRNPYCYLDEDSGEDQLRRDGHDNGRLSGTLSERSLIYEQSESFRPVLWTSD